MAHEMIGGTYRQINLPGESPEYLAKREELRLAEIELMKQRERCAELRRALPKGVAIPNYEVLQVPDSLDRDDVPVLRVKLSELCRGRLIADRIRQVVTFLLDREHSRLRRGCPGAD
jgi:predicted dithiol-disulfide oxidoreductase (DUF899 family)